MGFGAGLNLKAPVLAGELVRLEPLDHRHAADLAVSVEENRGSYDFTWVPRADEVQAYIDAQLGRAATGHLAPYAQVSTATGRAVGVTAYWEPRSWLTDDQLDSGSMTWRPSYSACSTFPSTRSKLPRRHPNRKPTPAGPNRPC